MVTDAHGNIIVHSDLDQVGKIHGRDIDFDRALQSKSVQWRWVPAGDGREVFEVYRRFDPSGSPRGRMPNRGGPPPHMRPGFPTGRGDSPEPQVIFVGLDNTAILAAHQTDSRHTIVMAVILLLVCVSGNRPHLYE